MIIKLILIILSFLCGRTDTDLVDLLRPTHILSQLGVLISGHPCEIKVTNVLNKNCENLTKQDIEWMALGFTNCFLERAGKAQVLCQEGQSFGECTSSMNSDQWQTYTSISTNIDAACIFYKYLAITSNAQSVIVDLSTSQSEMIETLVKNVDNVKYLTLSQEKIFTELRERKDILIENSEALTRLENSTSDLYVMLGNFVTEEINHIRNTITNGFQEITQNLNLLRQIERWAFGDYLTLGTLLFHIILFLLIKYVSSHPRLQNIGFIISLLQGLYFLLEKTMAKFMNEMLLGPEIKTYVTIIERLMFLSISFFLLWNKARQKENVDAETNQMLARLNQLLIDLRSRYSQPSQERNQAYMTPPRRRRNEDEIALRDYQLNFSE